MNIADSSTTTHDIVKYLDDYIIKQDKAKKLFAIAFRYRLRRMLVEPKELQKEITPKNILAVGPTGVGKTEIARRLASFVDAPFIKVEATKFTEIGYVGRDVESIIRDLMENAIAIVKKRAKKDNEEKARKIAEDKVVDILVGKDASEATREKFYKLLNNGSLGHREIEIHVKDAPQAPNIEIPGMGNVGMGIGVLNIGEMLGGGFKKTKAKNVTVDEALEILIDEEEENMLDNDKITKQAVTLCENEGIVFIDEIDKICGKSEDRGQVSRQGVQRDLLPLVEGCVVPTKYGQVNTDHILFIGSGAFHTAKPSDLLPELQGRFPVRVYLDALNEEDFVKILTKKKANLIEQYKALIRTEGVEVEFTKTAIDEIAGISAALNDKSGNIGARRLSTVMEKVMEDISYNAHDMKGKTVKIDKEYVKNSLKDLMKEGDLSRFIL